MKQFSISISIFLFMLNPTNIFGQDSDIVFGTEIAFDTLVSGSIANGRPINWINVNTDTDTWRTEEDLLICRGLPIGVMRSEKQYENFILEVDWRHMEAGGNSGVFVWSDASPNPESRLPGGVEVQMLELDWVNLNMRDGKKPPIAYVHGELFGVGGVKTIPDNPRGERSKSIENRAVGKGEWNNYKVICVDGTIKLSVNGKFVNGISKSTIKKGYLCLESEGAEIHFKNFKLIELPAGVSSESQKAGVIK
ncbi:MAG: 3-keto-disaccharide hydrolase [Aurantibacter sp.]